MADVRKTLTDEGEAMVRETLAYTGGLTKPYHLAEIPRN
jgi:hypothetical protein